MVDNRQAAGESKPQTASTSYFNVYFTQLCYWLKVSVYCVAPWLMLLGRLHG